MSTVETQGRPRIVIHPSTGEILPLDGPTRRLSEWLLEVRDLEQRLREEKQFVTQELLARMDREARYTLREGDFEIKGDGPTIPTEYDAQQLRQELQEFVDAEVITADALDRAVEVIPQFKARAQGLEALRKLGGGVAATIDRRSHPSENHQRRVSVKVRGQ